MNFHNSLAEFSQTPILAAAIIEHNPDNKLGLSNVRAGIKQARTPHMPQPFARDPSARAHANLGAPKA